MIFSTFLETVVPLQLAIHVVHTTMLDWEKKNKENYHFKLSIV